MWEYIGGHHVGGHCCCHAANILCWVFDSLGAGRTTSIRAHCWCSLAGVEAVITSHCMLPAPFLMLSALPAAGLGIAGCGRLKAGPSSSKIGTHY
jgi:hypothetical protein